MGNTTTSRDDGFELWVYFPFLFAVSLHRLTSRKERTVTRTLYLIINKAPHSHFLQLIHLCFAIRTILYLRTEIRV